MGPHPSYDLTEKESQILALMVQDDSRSVRYIADTLNISANYIYTLIRQMKLKLGVQNTAALIRRAIQEGVISPPPDKERLIIDWLNANPDKAHLSSRKIAALIGDVSHTLVNQARCRISLSRSNSLDSTEGKNIP